MVVFDFVVLQEFEDTPSVVFTNRFVTYRAGHSYLLEGRLSNCLTQTNPFSKAEPSLIVCKAGLEGRLVPQNPTTQCTCRGRVIPMFTHAFMTTQIPSSTSHILVLRKVRVSFLSERLNNLTSIGFDKDCIELLLCDVTLFDCLQNQLTSCFHLCLI